MRAKLIAAFAAGALIAGLVAVGGVAVAQPDGVELTACVQNNNGQMRLVDSGHDCLNSEYPVTWNQVGEPGPQGPEGPEGPPGPPGPGGETLDLFVDCDAGDTVGAALADAETHLGRLNITISGVCEENVGIDRDDVYIAGLERSDGIRNGSPTSHAVTIFNARGVRFENMTISGGQAGIFVGGGSVFFAQHVTVRDTTSLAIQVTPGSTLDLANSSIVDNEGSGVTAEGGSITIQQSFLSGNVYGVIALDGGTVWVFDSTVSENDVGVQAADDGVVRVAGSTIEANRNGVDSLLNSTIEVRDGSRIANNSEIGAHANIGSSVNIEDTAIENNGAQGIKAEGQSNVQVRDGVAIRNNQTGGIWLLDLSYGTGGTTEIRDNVGWGIECFGPAVITEAQNGFDMPSIIFSGNTAGDTNCP